MQRRHSGGGLEAPMASVQIYRGEGEFEPVELNDLLARLDASRSAVAVPFAPKRIELIGELSARLLADRRIVEQPALAYFAHWTRRAALRDLAARFNATIPTGAIAAPRGVALHFPPRNVETILLFSWVMSYLVGNTNVVRLPSERGAAVRRAIDLLVAALREAEDADLFIQYPADDRLSEALSRCSDVRVVWGGDGKIRAFESLPLRNGGKSIWFGDRYSYAVISGLALASATAAEMTELARNLALDIFTFDQMGCSSPHKVYIAGNSDAHGRAVAALIDAVGEAARRRGTAIPPSHSVVKLTEAMALAGAEPGALIPRLSGELMSVVVPHIRDSEDRVGGGFIVVEFITDIATLIGRVRPAHQTLTYYGFTTAELTDFAKAASLAGLSRIVPIGQALSFDAIWDGYELFRELTRTVRII
jgi:acyl-CoA reductase LuxC